MACKAWRIFSVSAKGKRELLETFESPEFTRFTVDKEADKLREAEKAGGCTVEVCEGSGAAMEPNPISEKEFCAMSEQAREGYHEMLSTSKFLWNEEECLIVMDNPRYIPVAQMMYDDGKMCEPGDGVSSSVEASAHMLAASRDLYEALEAMYNGGRQPNGWKALAAKARKALEKANPSRRSAGK